MCVDIDARMYAHPLLVRKHKAQKRWKIVLVHLLNRIHNEDLSAGNLFGDDPANCREGVVEGCQEGGKPTPSMSCD